MKAIAQLAELLPDESVRLDTNPLLLQDAPTSQRQHAGGRRTRRIACPSCRLSQQAMIGAGRHRAAATRARCGTPSAARSCWWARWRRSRCGTARSGRRSSSPPSPRRRRARRSPAVEHGRCRWRLPAAAKGDPRWAAALEEGQRFFATGDVDTALRKFKEAGKTRAPPARAGSATQVKLGARR